MSRFISGKLAFATLLLFITFFACPAQADDATDDSGIRLGGNLVAGLFFENTNTGHGAMLAPTVLENTNIYFPQEYRFQVGFRTDWNDPYSGVMQAQFAGLYSLNVRKNWGPHQMVQLGTLDYWGPFSSIPYGAYAQNGQYTKSTRMLAMGGPRPGLVGARYTGDYDLGAVDVKTGIIAGTGDRGLTGSLWDNGDKFYSLCQHNNMACGAVVGGNIDAKPTALPDLGLHAQFTRIGNESQLEDEMHTTLGADYTLPLTDGTSANLLGEYSNANHFQGRPSDLNIVTAALTLQAKLSEHYRMHPYLSATRLHGAVNRVTEMGGTVLSYKTNKTDAVSLEGYGGRLITQTAPPQCLFGSIVVYMMKF